MKYLLLIAALVTANFASASVFLTAKTSPKLARLVKHDSSLDQKIEKAIEKAVGAQQLYGFSVKWDTLRCLAADPSEMSGAFGGVCTVTAGAMQVGAQIAIVKADQKRATVTVVSVDEE